MAVLVEILSEVVLFVAIFYLISVTIHNDPFRTAGMTWWVLLKLRIVKEHDC